MKSKHALILVTLFLCNCKSSELRNDVQHQPADTSRVARLQTPALAIKQNVARVRAVVEKVGIIDGIQFSVGLFIISSESINGKTNLIEPQQRLTVYPEFKYAEADGSIDNNEPKNKRLLALRSAAVGQSFICHIGMDQKGLWKLLDVEL